MGVEGSGDDWSLVRKLSDSLLVTEGVLWSVSSSEEEHVSVGLVDVVSSWKNNSLLSVVSDGLETNKLDAESLHLSLSAWQPGKWGSWVEFSELKAELSIALPWEDPVTIIHEVLLNWSINPFSKCGSLELILLVTLVKGKCEVFSMEESK